MCFRAGILQISRVKFWKIDDFKNCFRDLLTFTKVRQEIKDDKGMTCLMLATRSFVSN